MQNIILFLFFLILFSGCSEQYTPKPRGFFRIAFPEKQYQQLGEQYPYGFDIPAYARVMPDNQNSDQPWWINIEIPENRAVVHISYYELPGSKISTRQILTEFMEEARELAYKHSIKANAIEEQIFVNRGDGVYGTVYRIEGNAASPVQFFLTDSTNHFLRGALYIQATPDIDSLKPVIDFLEKDVIRLIETTRWR
jgi:gliding motility-associated lipoprotein GldD